MFLVTAEYDLPAEWEEMDSQITIAAGRKGDSSSATVRVREIIWYVSTMGEAKRIKREVAKVNGVTVRLREK